MRQNGLLPDLVTSNVLLNVFAHELTAENPFDPDPYLRQCPDLPVSALLKAPMGRTP